MPVYKIDRRNARWRTVLEIAITEIRRMAEAGDCMIRVGDVLRSLDQNAKSWALLRDVATQVPMVINGVSQLTSSEDWKAVLTAGFAQEMRYAQNPHGAAGVIALGVSTKTMTRKQFSDYIEFIYAFGTERGVAWSEKALEDYSSYGRVRKEDA